MRPPTVPPVEAPRANLPVVSKNGVLLPPYSTIYYFDQLIDHNRPALGTFKQRYWFTHEFYEPGGPIILYTPGEWNAQIYTGFLTNATLPGMIAQQENGANIVLEHRFYGLSNPYPDLTAESFRVHTIQQAIDDLVYFARNVELPMLNGDKVTPDQAPWILVGGSYAEALSDIIVFFLHQSLPVSTQSKPGVFFAGYSSSGVVQATLDYWEYFEPIRQAMPQNCSADVQRVVEHLDDVFRSGNQSAIEDVKANFGLSELAKMEDVLSALRNNLWDWQELQPGSGPGTEFYRFCDALEVKDGVSAPAEGWGLEHALEAWGLYWRTRYYFQLCGFDDPECNEVGYLQNGAPADRPSLVSRLIQPPYDLNMCQLMFPTAFSKTPTPRTDVINQKYKGWNVRVDRVIFVDGARDPWRDTGLSARIRTPHVRGRTLQPIYLTNGFHCSDLQLKGAVDPTIAYARKQTLQHFNRWLKTFRPRPVWPPRPIRPFPPITIVPRPPVPKPRVWKQLVGGWFGGLQNRRRV
ncbi:endoprotease [Coprinopsis cinerea okayama7|uniref:Endoprotease n=1 Tax=Coprinopsis cinerea (strain Okayama-7 / 130 / ATCC MYA-4618 / FGSC 9003) TaxID=240176 RepID=A8NZ18_COPC7|nr:endoprotease [Coprinopsis cinerea okayama7\|eukprot:XP_001837581.2 endoprotease [Coprinopsis cinerea okayama7\